MDQPQRGISSDLSSNSTAASSSQMPHVLFREIHKNAFLKKHSSDRRTGFPRKTERVWVVFCVHDDMEAFLEMYPDQKVALTHKPEWFTSLANALHVSPSICGHEDEFEFAVTLSTQVIRLAAPTWDSMMEWVDTIRNKLRELKILSPKENLYSKMPEQKQPLLPTRDPNSPLPLPPDGPSTLLPGVEPVHLDTRTNIALNDTNDSSRHQREGFNRNNVNHERRTISVRQEIVGESSLHVLRETSQTSDLPNIPIQQLQNHNSNAEAVVPSNADNEVITHRPRIGFNRTVSVPEAAVQRMASVSTCSNITVIEVSCPTKRNSHSVSESNTFDYAIDNVQGETDSDDVFVTPPVTPKLVISNSCESSGATSGAHYEHVFLPNAAVTVDNAVLVNSSDFVKLHSNKIANSELNEENSSHEQNIPSTSSSVNISTENCHRKVGVANLPQVSSSADYKCGAPKACEENTCISQQVQSKLEKVTISGLIPRLPAKSSKHESTKKSHPAPVTSGEISKCSMDGENHSGQPSQKEVSSSVEEEVSADCPTPSPSYSQMKKIAKGKIKCEGSPREQDYRMLSPLPRRKPDEGETESQITRETQPVTANINKSHVKLSSGEVLGRVSKHGNINRSDAFTDTNHPASNSHYRNPTNISGPSTSGNARHEIPRNAKREVPNQNNNVDVEPLTATVQPAVGVISVEDIPLIGGHQRRRRRSSSSEATTSSSGNIARGIGGADRIRINVPLTHSSRDGHREEGEGRCSDVRNEAEQNPQVNLITKSSTRLTLREQQVLQLRREMMHPGGVRLQLRRKECVSSIALVDVLSGVWVAGWKQREHPMLYNALHIGDQLISVSDVVVRSAADAQKIFRSSSNIYIELIIRRLPFGRVFALHRSSEGQNLGIVQEGNTAEIRDVVPNSVAARAGLSPKTPSVDGLSLTTWFLTEINGRPLNLFFKDHEVRDRLNAVGKDISILVQPNDFIKQIKKYLKNIRSYKDYIVQ